jgi:hypothetical protein
VGRIAGRRVDSQLPDRYAYFAEAIGENYLV